MKTLSLEATGATAIRRRGQPLVLLALVLLSYGALRASIWETPFPIMRPLLAEALANASGRLVTTGAVEGSVRQRIRSRHERGDPVAEHWDVPLPVPSSTGWGIGAADIFRIPEIVLRNDFRTQVFADVIPASPTRRGEGAEPVRNRVVKSHLPDVTAAPPGRARPDRWSLDSWLFVRDGSPAFAANGIRPASYGASQAGAVLRYRLAPQNKRRPVAYLRATRALAGTSATETEAAIGLAARPVARLPLAAHAEIRLRSSAGRVETRPAAFIVSEFSPARLPLGIVGEGYFQGGYVGGDFATGFADGQMRVSREVAGLRIGKLRAGAGMWGGAQRDAVRLDIGPSANVDFRIGKTNGRAQLDYRMRVAGDAQPGDGLAFTLSTGF